MFEIRYAANIDKAFWFMHDNHISEDEFLLKVRDKRAYIISIGGKSVGIMRYVFLQKQALVTAVNVYIRLSRFRGFLSCFPFSEI